jgi:hypothetical protein
MAREPKYGVTLNGWERLLGSMEANAGDFPQFDTYRAQLKAMLDGARDASAQQAALAAEKQQATQRLQSVLADGRKLANFLRNGVRQRYGNRSEKLVEFGLRPFRSRIRALAPVTKKPPQPAAEPIPDKP